MNPGKESDARRQIVLKRLVLCDATQQSHVRHIRNQHAVRKAMYTDHIISEKEHRNWLDGLNTDARQIVFAVLGGDPMPIGIVSITALDTLHRKSDWAFYLDEKERGGLGAALEYALIEYAFNDLSLEKLNCEVLEINDVVVKMHKKFAFEEEGLRRSNIEKDGRRVGVVLLGLTREDWLANRQKVRSKYDAILNRFSVSIVTS
ncbi:UDP-4-amino-4,6-dideoxy-N-acetyl-beta-L-altrosamine N-acetyltransferase [Allopusillimonas soli]|uniref:UDP-4-amino-4, 6-dideoxy-N-acetyl-beta-L-altrosamine N-acetyltransferase n=1 Tax=Allopusillimonas soli TaxID=659016 RepID=A0A853FDP4_9BURK|nr:UDP-4-amino-4,6-dideoxy-N-acetyl-beta-L-altrosamine N-acetyltransferase [Allopusillimonas soli]NYT38019.1 UDP-4-amino-4,6-dideoxy-N-acetyl-beta-L-altrosamine N-acetyltransferase [Allopusillimonas soli]TEA73912.1 UDP-4-amino-4,6-dideoxy-N-acetyl-beta-L-altrosamine N-acetyltransferase [Allopusillimonas soli]